MKIQLTTIVGFLLPLAAMAAPAAEAAPEGSVVEAIGAQDTSPEAIGLDKRASVKCKIENTSSTHVNCRSGPKLSDSIIGTIAAGKTATFTCYKKGDCYENNCTWDKTTVNGKTCYVNGYYTDDKCTAARLGKC